MIWMNLFPVAYEGTEVPFVGLLYYFICQQLYLKDPAIIV